MKFSTIFCFIFLLAFSLIVNAEEKNTPKPTQKETTKKEATKKESTQITVTPTTDPTGEAVELAIAEVNNQKIYMSALAMQMRMMNIDPKGSNMSKENFIKARDQIIDSLIDQELLYEEAKKAGLEPKDTEVDTRIAEIKAQEPRYEQILKMQGLTEKKFTVLVKRNLTMQNFIEKKIQPTAKPVTDEDIKQYYEENKAKYVQKESVKASHILLKVELDAPEEDKTRAKNKLQSILQEARSGGDFAELAKKNSQDPGSAPQGGNLGYFSRGQMVKPFEDAAFALKPGGISDVVETQFGYHIILLQDKKPGKQLSVEESKKNIEGALSDKYLNDALAGWIKPIKEKASIKILLKSETTPQAETPKTAPETETPQPETPKE
ncbi:MAG: peptidylprolyl isomerase [Candidatus Poribacteria bacterium]